MSDYFKLLQQPDTNSIPPNKNIASTVNSDTLQAIYIDDLLPYEGNPFRPYSLEELEKLSRSIIDHGLIVPILVRHYQGKYQIVSGHNRVRAMTLLDKNEIPAIVRQMTDDEAAITLVETNFKSRTSFLHSEKSKAYKLEYEAKKQQGARMDLTSGTLYQKKTTAAEEMSAAVSDSEKRIRQYVKVAELIEPLLEWLDHNKLPFLSAYYLAFLNTEEQNIVLAYFLGKEPISMELAEIIKNNSGSITEDFLNQITGTKKKSTVPKQIKIKYNKIESFFQAGETVKEMEDIIIKALTQYYNKE